MADEPAPLIYPCEISPELREVLGMMSFRSGPIAHAFRDAGRANIPRRVEDEQAFVLHWLITLVLEHGQGWCGVAAATLNAVADEAKAARGKAPQL